MLPSYERRGIPTGRGDGALSLLQWPCTPGHDALGLIAGDLNFFDWLIRTCGFLHAFLNVRCLFMNSLGFMFHSSRVDDDAWEKGSSPADTAGCVMESDLWRTMGSAS